MTIFLFFMYHIYIDVSANALLRFITVLFKFDKLFSGNLPKNSVKNVFFQI